MYVDKVEGEAMKKYFIEKVLPIWQRTWIVCGIGAGNDVCLI